MTSRALHHDSSRDIVEGFLHDTLARLGWYGAQAWWSEGDQLVPSGWAVSSAAPAELRDHCSVQGPLPLVEATDRYLHPSRVPARQLACSRPIAGMLAENGIHDVIVHDIPGMFDFDVRLVFVAPGDLEFTEDVAESLASAARLMPTVIRQERERSALSHTASHDPLTGLLNRRGLDEALAALPPTSGLRALIFIDLDKFKSVNDTHGHPVGDDVLVDVATHLSAQIRPSDCLARVGGDEFVMVASQVASPESALILAQRLLGAISRDLLSHAGALVSIAASVGVALWMPDQSMPEVLASADRLMYEAKRFGGGIASQDDTGRIVISDAWADSRETAAARGERPALGLELVVDLVTDAPWGALVTLGGELSTLSADVVTAVIGEALATAGATGDQVILELAGLGWARGDILAQLLEAIIPARPASAVSLMLTATTSTEPMRLAVAEAKARFGVGCVLIGGGTEAAALSWVETDRPRALALSHEVTASMGGDRPRSTLVRMVAAVAEVIDVPVIARAVASPAARTQLAEAGCRLGTVVPESGTRTQENA